MKHRLIASGALAAMLLMGSASAQAADIARVPYKAGEGAKGVS